jgi:hypothetical protein
VRKKVLFYLAFRSACTNVGFAEDRLRLNNAQEKWIFSWHCLWLALSLPAAKIGGALG